MGRDLVNLFNVNPPPEPLLARLFVGRDVEMELALDALATRSTANEILAVHGEMRTGKSHFVRVLLQKLAAREGAWRTVTVMANHRGGVRPVLDDLFLALWKLLPVALDKVPASDRHLWEDFQRDQEQRRRLVAGEYAEQSRETSQGTTATLEAKGSVGPSSLSLGVTDRAESRHNEAERTVLRAPVDAQVVEWIRDLLDALRDLEAQRPVLLFVDDLDLLERRRGAEGSACADLVQRLLAIATHPHATVLVTVRTAWFNGHDKELNDFVTLRFFDDDVLRAIYQRHVDELYEARPVLDESALDLVVRESNGQVGMFLKSCRDLFQWGYKRLPLDEGAVADFVDARLRDFKRMPECVAHLPAIEAALRAQKLTVELKGDLHDTPLLYTVLQPVPNQADQYLLNPLWSRALLRAKP